MNLADELVVSAVDLTSEDSGHDVHNELSWNTDDRNDRQQWAKIGQREINWGRYELAMTLLFSQGVTQIGMRSVALLKVHLSQRCKHMHHRMTAG